MQVLCIVRSAQPLGALGWLPLAGLHGVCVGTTWTTFWQLPQCGNSRAVSVSRSGACAAQLSKVLQTPFGGMLLHTGVIHLLRRGQHLGNFYVALKLSKEDNSLGC
jgi:hypothetical protein